MGFSGVLGGAGVCLVDGFGVFAGFFVGWLVCLGVEVFLCEVKRIININEKLPTETTDFLLDMFLSVFTL